VIGASALLIVIGVSDLLHSRLLAVPPQLPSLPFPPPGWRRWVLALTTLFMFMITMIFAPWWAGIGFVLGALMWLLSYYPKYQTRGFIAAGLIVLSLVLPALFNPTTLRLTPIQDVSGISTITQWSVAIAAMVLINIATANRVVRAVLGFAHGDTPPQHMAGPSRAGRVIGVLERFLLIVLIIAGQSMSVAGLAAAKSIIRYPEISATARGGQGLSAETFFVGTITSWLFALASTGIAALSVLGGSVLLPGV